MKSVFVTQKVNCGAVGFAASTAVCNEGRVSTAGFRLISPSVRLRGHLRKLAGGLTSRAVLKKYATMQMVDAHFPTSDGRELGFQRYPQPEKDQKMLLAQLGWELPDQPPLRIKSKGALQAPTI
jgi:hypothetical protein